MTRAELVRALEKAAQRSSTTCDACIAAGYGHLRPSDMAVMRDPPPVVADHIAARAAERPLLGERDRRMAWHGNLHKIIRKL